MGFSRELYNVESLRAGLAAYLIDSGGSIEGLIQGFGWKSEQTPYKYLKSRRLFKYIISNLNHYTLSLSKAL